MFIFSQNSGRENRAEQSVRLTSLSVRQADFIFTNIPKKTITIINNKKDDPMRLHFFPLTFKVMQSDDLKNSQKEI